MDQAFLTLPSLAEKFKTGQFVTNRLRENLVGSVILTIPVVVFFVIPVQVYLRNDPASLYNIIQSIYPWSSYTNASYWTTLFCAIVLETILMVDYGTAGYFILCNVYFTYFLIRSWLHEFR